MLRKSKSAVESVCVVQVQAPLYHPFTTRISFFSDSPSSCSPRKKKIGLWSLWNTFRNPKPGVFGRAWSRNEGRQQKVGDLSLKPSRLASVLFFTHLSGKLVFLILNLGVTSKIATNFPNIMEKRCWRQKTKKCLFDWYDKTHKKLRRFCGFVRKSFSGKSGRLLSISPRLHLFDLAKDAACRRRKTPFFPRSFPIFLCKSPSPR